MKKDVVTLLVLSVFLLQGVSAQLSLTEPYDTYNLGDKLYITATGVEGADTGNLDINLLCQNQSISLVRIPSRTFVGSNSNTYAVPYKILDNTDLAIGDVGTIIGTCKLSAAHANQYVTTKEFIVTDEIDVDVAIDKTDYNPGEVVTIQITAVKANGETLEGIVEVSGATSFEKAVIGGQAKEKYEIPDTLEAGTYSLAIYAYDRGAEGILNEGNKTITYRVNQVPTFIKTSLSDEQATPGEPFRIGAEAFDQSGKAMQGTVYLRVTSPYEESKELEVQSGEETELAFASNATAGIWKIIAAYEGVIDEREFEMRAVQKALFTFEEDHVLLVKNIGNTVYNKTITVKIGEEARELVVAIDVGEERNYDVSAPNGEYQVTVTDGEEELTGNLLLTGRAISVKDLTSPGIFGTYPFLWIIVLLVIGGIVAYVVMRRGKLPREHLEGLTKKIGSVGKKVGAKIPTHVKTHAAESVTFTRKSARVGGLDEKAASPEDKSMVDFTKKNIGIAESSATIKGEEQQSAVLALHIMNYTNLNDHGKNALRQIVENACGEKGLIDSREDYQFVLYSPLRTKTFKNEMLTARCAMKIKEGIEQHNKKFTSKIEYGIGIHTGMLVASRANGNVKYTSRGNTISYAKKLSDMARGQTYLSEEIRKKLIREISVEKKGLIGEKQSYALIEIKDRTQDEAKLKELLKRM